MSYSSMKCALVLVPALAFGLTGCGFMQKEADPQDAMIMENTETTTADAKSETPPTTVEETQATATETPPTTVTEAKPAADAPPERVGSPKNSMPDLPYLPGSDKASVETAPEKAESDADAEVIHEPDPPSPKTAPPAQQASKIFETKDKSSKPAKGSKTVKFKLPKKSMASVTLSEKGKDLVIQLKASQVKNGKYWVFMEKSCKKSSAGKPVKLATFQVKNGKKFSGQAKTRAATLQKDSKKGLKGKSLVLYHGPKANDRLSCSVVK